MTSVTQDSLAILALTNRLEPSDVPPLKASEVWRLLEKVPEISTLLGLASRTISDLTGVPAGEAERVGRLLDSGVGLAVKLDSLLEVGIVPLTALDPGYPRRLRQRLDTAAPPVLYCAGELSLLEQDGIGVVGSRDVGPEAVEATRAVATVIASAELSLVSGGAKGVDKISMAAASEAGGRVVGVLADSLEQAISRRDNRQALLEGVACLCTPYSPAARFTAGNAMGRNKIIYGLSRVTVVIASAQGEGGTWSGATEAIRKRYGRVAVWMGPGTGPGNAPLVKAGGTPFERAAEVLDLDELDGAGDGPAQMALSLNARSDQDETAEPSDAGVHGDSYGPAGENAGTGPALAAPPVGALAPQPTGTCWCGCGNPVKEGVFFLPRHTGRAAQQSVVKHFGSVESFLLMFGDAPRPDVSPNASTASGAREDNQSE